MYYDQKYILYFFSALVAGLLLILSFGFYVEPITGDLTRVGGWAERDYGWVNILPEIPVDDNVKDVRSADILVLGDSFSWANMWQSVLGRSLSRRVASHNYVQFNCIADWLEMLVRGGHVAGKAVIVESLERLFVSRFSEVEDCRGSRSSEALAVQPFDVSANREVPTYKRTGRTIPTDVVYLLKVAMNSLLLEMGGGRRSISGLAVNAPLASRDLFSNRRSDRILYYYEDDAESTWSDEQIGKAVFSILAIQRRIEAAGGRFLFVLVPNKSSVYARFIVGRPDVDRYTPIVRRLRDTGVGAVDVLAPFSEHAEKEADFYLPDDTHVSTKGYRVLGEVIAGEMRKMAAR